MHMWTFIIYMPKNCRCGFAKKVKWSHSATMGVHSDIIPSKFTSYVIYIYSQMAPQLFTFRVAYSRDVILKPIITTNKP